MLRATMHRHTWLCKGNTKFNDMNNMQFKATLGLVIFTNKNTQPDLKAVWNSFYLFLFFSLVSACPNGRDVITRHFYMLSCDINAEIVFQSQPI